jgi:hypothetical protein
MPRAEFELGYANLLLQEMTAKAIARFRYSWENIAVRLVVRQRLAAQGFKPIKPRAEAAPHIPMDFRAFGEMMARAITQEAESTVPLQINLQIDSR